MRVRIIVRRRSLTSRLHKKPIPRAAVPDSCPAHRGPYLLIPFIHIQTFLSHPPPVPPTVERFLKAYKYIAFNGALCLAAEFLKRASMPSHCLLHPDMNPRESREQERCHHQGIDTIGGQGYPAPAHHAHGPETVDSGG